MLAILLCLLAILEIVRVESADTFTLYDLSVDPYESNDVYGSSAYTTTAAQLVTKIDQWSAQVTAPKIPETYSKHAFSVCGGVCPWADTETAAEPAATSVKYTSEGAPNIIFLMTSDWGWNDVGFRSTYLNWATPNIDLLASEGVTFSNYYTHANSVPSRGALLTGRYPLRLGLWSTDVNADQAELPVEEVTIATEMKSAGYKTYMVGKWGMGMSTSQHMPTERGFDYFYGQLSSETHPYTKLYEDTYLDLYSGASLVTDSAELSSDVHVASLYETKAESFLSFHSQNFPDTPMFMYYGLPLLQEPKSDIPSQYLAHCDMPDTMFDDDAATELQYYCAMQVMLDEIVGSLTCSLVNNGMANNTLVVLTSDNGGDTDIKGNNYPFAGGKGTTGRGGVSVNTIVHGAMLSSSKVAGKTYTGQMHVTDWLPTLMSVATNQQWTGSYGGNSVAIDGVDMWTTILNDETSPRSEIVHFADGMSSASIQVDMVKVDKNPVTAKSHKPDYIFTADKDVPGRTALTCSFASLMYPNGEPDISEYYRLFDLTSDPYEQVNVYKNDDYADKLSYLQTLGEQWQNSLATPVTPDYTNKLQTWVNECGSTVCAWDDKTEFEPLKQSDAHKTSFKPHVIFVMVENWGYNDMGAHSTYLSWTTPNIDRLADEAVTLTNYYTHSTSLPSRAAILTGRYAARTGFWDETGNFQAGESVPELPLEETTLAQEMKNLGYMTYMVGKWGLGVSTQYHWPSNRGFDFFYGQLTDQVDPYTKRTADGVLDLHNCTYGVCDVVKNSDSETHVVFEYEAKLEEYFTWHSTYHSRQPMFMYYSLPMMQYPYQVPDYYLERCASPTLDDASLSEDQLQAMQNYCASSVLLDEVITNMTCTIKADTTRNNTVIVLTSANGAMDLQTGANWPYNGYSGDGSIGRGAISVNALIHGPSTTILPSAQGVTYSGQMHAVDWYPTLLTIASGQQWKSSFTGATLDGINLWSSIIFDNDNNNDPGKATSPRADMIHSVTTSSYSVQSNMIKYDYHTTYLGDLSGSTNKNDADTPPFVFEEDLNYRLVAEICYKPSFLYSFTDPRDIYYMYDLETDPNEEDSVADQRSEDLNALLERCDYWNTQVEDPSVPETTGKTAAFTECGGICPWLSTSDEVAAPSSDVLLYNNANAPNIVFVLVDDWGWNDAGYRSTYMSWTTPNIDKLAGEGIKFNNYFSHFSCMPSRGAFLTGRYAMRLGLWQAHENAELPLSETTIAQEMKSAGYRTALIGKWHQGYSTQAHLPTQRGFDVFYGYLNGYVDYWTKSYGSHLDLHDGDNLETDPAILSSSVHNAYVLQSKAEALIADHATYHSDQPLFLYYAMQLIHGVWAAPEVYLKRCSYPSSESIDDDYVRDVEFQYCGMNIMLDEAIANLTCALEAFNMMQDTVMIVVSDNGGEQTVSGNSYPFRGGKGSHFRGGISTNGFIHSAMIPEAMKGQSYDGQFHITGKLYFAWSVVEGNYV
jgi:arylsulfatase B